MSQGILTFPTMADAVRVGFVLHDKNTDGTIIVRRHGPDGWEQALVGKPEPTHAEKVQALDADIPSPKRPVIE